MGIIYFALTLLVAFVLFLFLYKGLNRIIKPTESIVRLLVVVLAIVLDIAIMLGMLFFIALYANLS